MFSSGEYGSGATHHGVAVVPGSEFGTPGYFRLCFAKSEDDLKNACQRINDFLKLLN